MMHLLKQLLYSTSVTNNYGIFLQILTVTGKLINLTIILKCLSLIHHKRKYAHFVRLHPINILK